MAASRTVKSEREFIYIPHDSRERFLPLQLPPNDFLRKQGITMGGLSNWSKNYRLERNRSPDHLMLYTLGGSAWLAIDHGKPVELTAGDLFIAPSQSVYAYRTRGSRWESAWLHLGPRSQWDALMAGEPRVRKALSADMLVRVITGYMEEADLQGVESAQALQAYVELMVVYLRRELESGSLQQAERNLRLKAILGKVQSSLQQDWTVEKLAALAGTSRAQLHRIVPELTGRSPMKMIHALRMDRASELLIYTGQTLAVIAEEVGYDNPFAFSKAFKRYTGTSPAEFRKRA
jgi:AraC-like DNA-binding protein